MVERIKGIHKVRWRLADGTEVTYHRTAKKNGKLFWTGASEDGVHMPGYADAWRGVMGLDRSQPATAASHEKVADMIDAWMRSREWAAKAPRTRRDYERGLRDIRSKFGSWDARKLINDPDLGDIVLRWIEKRGWQGKEADRRLDPYKFLCSWLIERKRSRFPTNHLRGIKGFYKSPDRSGIVWTDDEVARFAQVAPEPIADAVIFMRETGLRPGDLVRVARQHIFARADGGKALIIRTSKKGSTANVPLSPTALVIVAKAPLERQLILARPRAAAWDEQHLSKEVKRVARLAGLRPELRFYDFRGSKVTELIWKDRVTVAELALQMGWDMETAAKMMGVYGSKNPDALNSPANVVALPVTPRAAQ